MYEYLTGKITAVDNDFVVIENNGIGYRIYTAASTLEALTEGKEGVKLYTHLHIREGVMDLYGFATRDELNMFKLLLTVTGIGPRAAVSVLSAVRPAGFALAVVTDDVDTLTRAQGIGKKTAQKIILELKDKIGREQFASLPESKPAVADRTVFNEAVSALMVLGYTSLEANRAVEFVGREENDLEMIIKKALRFLAGS
jgi:Holliday junction DNA helicase RuvA